MPTLTTNALDALLFVRNGYSTARWNFSAAVGSSPDEPAGTGQGVSLTYSLLGSVPSYYGAAIAGFQSFSPMQAQAVRSVLKSVQELTQLKFTETSGVGQLTFGNSIQPSNQAGYAYNPGFSYSYTPTQILSTQEHPLSGDVWLNQKIVWPANAWLAGGSGYSTLLHEVGHALGLKHPFEAPESGFFLEKGLDNESQTVMSYTLAPNSTLVKVSGTASNYSWTIFALRPSTFMPLDIEALQHLYGANLTTRAGNTTYRWALNPEILETIWDGGGTDTIDCSNQTLRCVINLQPGSYSSISLRQTDAEKRAGLELPSWFKQPLPVNVYDGSNNLAIAKGTTIENAIGGRANDLLFGNEVNNVLSGGAGNDSLAGFEGNDTLDGGSGSDTLIGGSGDDLYCVHDLGDVVVEELGEGIDTVYSYLAHTAGKSYLLSDNVEIGRIATSATSNMTGNALDNLIYAGSGSNVIQGGDGNDTVSYQYGLTSGAKSGVVVNLSLLTAQATGSSGLDSLLGVENLIGTALNDVLTGNALDNWLNGGSGNDALNGGEGQDTLEGGTGKDLLTGGAGSDVFLFKTLGDTSPTLTLCDVITDFVCGVDNLNLSGLDANTTTAQKDDFLESLLNASTPFTAAGQLRFSAGVLYGNTDADADAEFAIQLTGVTDLLASDLML